MPKQTTTEKAAATPAKKTASRKKVVFTLQFAGKELTVAEMEALAVAAWMEQTGGLKKDAKDIQLYAKPEDSCTTSSTVNLVQLPFNGINKQHKSPSVVSHRRAFCFYHAVCYC